MHDNKNAPYFVAIKETEVHTRSKKEDTIEER